MDGRRKSHALRRRPAEPLRSLLFCRFLGLRCFLLWLALSVSSVAQQAGNSHSSIWQTDLSTEFKLSWLASRNALPYQINAIPGAYLARICQLPYRDLYFLVLLDVPVVPLSEVPGVEASVEPEPGVPDPDAPAEPLPEVPVEGASVGVASVGRPAPDVETSPGEPLVPVLPVAPLASVVAPLALDVPLDELCATAIPEMLSAETSAATSSLLIYHLPK